MHKWILSARVGTLCAMRNSAFPLGMMAAIAGRPAAAQGAGSLPLAGSWGGRLPGMLLVGTLALGLGWSLDRFRRRGQAVGRAAESAPEREALLAGILDAVPVALSGRDPGDEYRYRLWNAKAAETYGLERGQVLGRTDFELFPEEAAAASRNADLEAVRGGRPVTCKGPGGPRPDSVRVALPGAGGLPRLVLSVDGQAQDPGPEQLARTQILEEGFRQSQKLESLGVLAGGIAHDFNNLLSALGGNLELAQMSLPAENQATPFFLKIEKILRRASELTQQMLAYSGRSRRVVRTLGINLIAEELPLLLEVSISKRVVLVYRLAPNLPPIEADGAQIQQVIMNLVTNASEAIGERDGTITLTTGSTFLDAPQEQVESHGWVMQPGLYVTLEVTDTGCGMSEETRARLFDPFFTTKFSGRGLGLSAMLGILRSHSAGVRIHSTEGEGTSFKLYFPASQAGPAAVPAGPARVAGELPTGSVLVVDDEPDILEATAELLTAIGFKVVTARDGLEALELYRANPKAFCLVLMDLTMPRMDGREALKALRALDPDLKIVLCSGFDQADVARDGICTGMTAFLQKPYSIQTLKEAMLGALGA